MRITKRKLGSGQPKVTVVIPVYKNAYVLQKCLASLQKYLDHRHTVLVVDDSDLPDESKLIKKTVQKAIKYGANFKYYKNEHNLGFIQTCNRAVYDLDKTNNDILLLNSDTVVTRGFLEEMSAVLYLAEKHGVVSPRSNNATIMSIPRYPRTLDDNNVHNFNYSWRVYKKIKNLLPRYSLAPTGHGFCLLIKRALIKNFGLFDPVYDKGYCEENDFCLRLNKYGFSMVIANQTYVYHFEGKSFSPEKKQMLVNKNIEILQNKYPYYHTIINKYSDSFIDPLDRFADVIANTKTRKILINLFHMPTIFCGTTINIISFLAYLRQNKRKYPYIEWVLLAQEDSAAFFTLSNFGFRVITPSQINAEELFDLGYTPLNIFHLNNLLLLNKHCLKIIVANLDLISVRSHHLLAKDFRVRSLFYDSFRFADGVVCISEATKQDTLAYYGRSLLSGQTFKVIPQGFSGNVLDNVATHRELCSALPENLIKAGGYLFIFGNSYAHKALQETLSQVQGKWPIIVLGDKNAATPQHKVWQIEAGHIPNLHLKTIIQNASILLFPSLYEGFGFPIAEAAYYGKPLIAANTAAAREVANLFKGSAVRFYDEFSDIPKLVKELLSLKKVVQSARSKKRLVRTMDDYNAETLQYINEIIRKKVKPEKLRDRWLYFSQIKEYVFQKSSFTTNEELKEVLNSRAYRYGQKLRAILRWFVPTDSFRSRCVRRLVNSSKKINTRWSSRKIPDKMAYNSIANSVLFNKKWYLKSYPDVRESKVDPVVHYLNYGWKEGRDPSPKFSTKYYLAINTDVAMAKLCPLLHYEYAGKNENRKVYPPPPDFAQVS
jgi:GT2 family glycosyltransferase